MKKFIINENWELEEVEDLDNLFVVIFKHGSFDQGYVEAFDTDDVLMQGAYDSLSNQYGDCGCDELTKIYLIRVPNTDQTVNMCNTGLFNGNCCDPHVIEATRDLFNRADCEQLAHWAGAGLTEAKKKKNNGILNGTFMTVTTGDPDLNIKHFNQRMGTDFGKSEQSQGATEASIAGSIPSGESGGLGEALVEADDLTQIKGTYSKLLSEHMSEINEAFNSGIVLEDFRKLVLDIIASAHDTPAKRNFILEVNKTKNSADLLFLCTNAVLRASKDTRLNKWNNESLEEADQLDEASNDLSPYEKMKRFNQGQRRENVKACSDTKLIVYRNICIQYGFTNAQRQIEEEMYRRGLLTRKKAVNLPITLGPRAFNVDDAEFIWEHRNEPGKCIDSARNDITALLVILLWTICLKLSNVTAELKKYILDNFDITIDQVKEILKTANNNPDVQKAIKDVLGTGNFTESLEEDLLDEDKIWAARAKAYYELPAEIKILSKDDVEKFINELQPEEYFDVGYITPIYFYKELDDKFILLKATELNGYTGIDFRDASGTETDDHEDRLKRANQQIQDNPNGAKGYKLNPHGDKFSAEYSSTNKLVKSDTKTLETGEVDDQGQAIRKPVDLNRILFYPKVGSTPKVIYYLDLKNGKGLRRIPRDKLVSALYQKVKELAFAKDNQVSDADRKKVQKLGFTDIIDFAKQFPGMSVSDYEYAIKNNIDPKVYLTIFPFSRRWTMAEFSAKVEAKIAEDDQTISSKPLKAGTGFGRGDSEGRLGAEEEKPQVRALYSQQIYYLGKPGEVHGKQLDESLTEAHRDDPEVVELTNEIKDDVKQLKDLGINKVELDEAKRYVKRYYVRPQNIFCSNKEDILQALLRVGDENCSVYSLKNLSDHDDVQNLKPSDIIYYYDDHVLYDKNHVQVMDYDLFVKHEEDRKKVANVDTMSDAAFAAEYDDRVTDDDLKDKDVIANFRAINAGEFKESITEDTEDQVNLFELNTEEKEVLDKENPFELEFESFNVYGESLKEGKENKFVCCICGEECEGYGNNPAPVKEDGKCCDACNKKFVIPARLNALSGDEDTED